jgi:hypothetical protein
MTFSLGQLVATEAILRGFGSERKQHNRPVLRGWGNPKYRTCRLLLAR